MLSTLSVLSVVMFTPAILPFAWVTLTWTLVPSVDVTSASRSDTTESACS